MWVKRIGIYILGMITVSTGIVLCSLCDWGISPVSSWPYIMTSIVPLSFGTFTMIFHIINILAQYIMERKLVNVMVWLQVPVALILGILIDRIKALIHFDATVVTNQIIALALSVFLTALGMVFMIDMDLIRNPPDGCVKVLSRVTGIEVGNMKLIYDFVMLISSNLTGYLMLGNFRGFGIATIVSAVFVGKIFTLAQKLIGEKLKGMVSLKTN